MVHQNRIANNIRRKYRNLREKPAQPKKTMAPVPLLKKALTEMSTKLRRLKTLNMKMKSHGTAPLTKPDVTRYMDQVKTFSEEIEELYTTIKIEETDATKDDQHDKDFDAAEALADETMVGFTAILASFPADPTPTSSGSSSGGSGVKCQVKLPTINLPTFSGDSNDWITFRDIFTTTVHNNKDTSDSMKMTYLQSVLTGSAAKLIRSMPISDANYTVAWDTIKKRYENKRQLFLTIARKFASLPNTVGDNPNSLRSLIDATNEFTRAVDTLGIADKWDATMLFLISQKLDPTSKQFWELSLTDTEIPAYQKLLDFMEQRARSLSVSLPTKRPESGNQSQQQHKPRAFFTSSEPQSSQRDGKCRVCRRNHEVYDCDDFKSLSLKKKNDKVQISGLCFLCLKPGHGIRDCEAERCQECGKKHHTLLHPSKKVSFASATTSRRRERSPTLQAHFIQADTEEEKKISVLPTAQVRVLDGEGNAMLARAFLDGGATASFVTESCANRLGLSRRHCSKEVTGMGEAAVGRTRGLTTLRFTPHFQHSAEEAFTVEAYIVKKVTANLPTTKLNRDNWSHLNNLQLADPAFHIPSTIDIMLGADVFYDLLLDGKKKATGNSPVATNSKLGWLVGGLAEPQDTEQVHVFHTDIDLHEDMQKFWELEAVPKTAIYSPEERACEEHFLATHSRDATGRYVVHIPLKTPQVPVGDSRDIAVRRLKSVERRLELNPPVQKLYKDVMLKYVELGHMTKIPAGSSKTGRIYLPHHFVLKDENNLDKFRCVFDGSAKTSSGRSSNEAQMVGPTVQAPLITTLTRFRIHVVAFTADISKMYRQVLVAPEDRRQQCILWRESPSLPIEEYELNTVTYGTAAAPFLATRALKQLGEDEREKFPLAARVVQEDFYVDDCMSGAKNTAAAAETIRQLREITAAAGFPLCKFASNDVQALKDVPVEMREVQDTLAMDDEDAVVRTLGLLWNTATDELLFRVKTEDSTKPITKRQLLSEMSKIFDPLGWLAPTIILTKILMQDVWREKTEWDELLPQHIQSRWDTCKKTLKTLEQLRIPRCIMPEENESVELHGFSDASEKAYSAVVYVRAKSQSGKITVSIISAKSKVAPVKTVSIPRLELCGALLLADLMENVQESLDLEFSAVKAWTDSTIVLAWLAANPSRWKTFVANRVAKITEIIPSSCWGHVRGIENPADCASRGIFPEELCAHPLWWHGPRWLLDEEPVPAHGVPSLTPDEIEIVKKERKEPTLTAMKTSVEEDSILSRFSSLIRLKRVTALCQRLACRARARVAEKKANAIGSTTTQPMSSPLTVQELDAAFRTWVKIMQASAFSTELKCLMEKKPLPNSSNILALSPFLDSDGILRVGGRLRHAVLPMDKKHPILFPRYHKLTELVIAHAHLQLFHGGSQLVQNVLSQKFWILRVKDAIKFQQKKCVSCTRRRGELLTQKMGDLPAARVNMCRPFSKTGVDYAGPFLLRAIPTRSKVTYKAYVAVFVCFVTRAIHLETVSSLSTEAFIAALRRFTARRGKPSDMYSDCGSNFKGASRELQELFSLVQSEDHNKAVADSLSTEGIAWHFNPPGAPHMGGLWEAGVKSMKLHLQSVLGPVRLTFEEMQTALSQIEACLNSRPLTPMSNNPDDLAALTPAHFLIGDSLFSVPDPDLTSIPRNRLSRWQLVQHLKQHVWRRWSKEFLTRLQQRPKWLAQKRDVEVGDMVLVKTDGLISQAWPLARVVAVHPGADGLTRVVSVRTAKGETKRPVHKLCLLPIDRAGESNGEEPGNGDVQHRDAAPKSA